MKKSIILVSILFILVGCSSDKLSLEKDDYLVFKEELLEQTNFTNSEDLNFDINISIDRVNDEEISYRAIIDNPKENMYNVKALVVHDYFTEEIFPSIGIFDNSVDLLVDSKDVKGINLVGYIKTTKEIKDLNLDVRVYIEYINDSKEAIKIYYKTTN